MDTKIKLQKAAREDFDLVYDALEENFIPEERRERDVAHSLAEQGKYVIYHVEDGGARVGFITVWELSGFAFVEHFVIYEKFRNAGYGGKSLEELKKMYDKIVLEAEPPRGEMPTRRIGFYRRNGFIMNEQFYLQPPYRENESGVELVLMSYPAPLADFHATAGEIYEKVYEKRYNIN